MATVPLGAVTNVYLIWYTPSGSGWSPTDKSIIRNFLNNLGGSPWWGIMGSYMDALGSYISAGAKSVAVMGEATVAGRSINMTDNDVWLQVSDAVTSNTFPSDANAVYFVLTDSSVNQGASGSFNGFCGQ